MRQKKQRSNAAVNSRLIRRPIQRCFAIFLLPTFAAFCIGFLYPFIHGLYLSFCKFTTTSNAKWVGLDNYVRAFKDASFVHAFGYTALVAVTSLVIINILAFAVAYALTRGIRGSNLFRGVFFMPNLIGGIVLGYIWSMIFDGFLSRYNTSIVLNATYGYWGLIIMLCWQQIGYMMIIYIAGLQALPGDVLEAAAVDGATNTQTLFQITIPLMMPSITVCSFLTVTGGFKMFDQNLALTNGAPSNSSELLALNIYRTFYGRAGFEGVGQAKAVVFFIIVALIAIIQNRLTTSKEVSA